MNPEIETIIESTELEHVPPRTVRHSPGMSMDLESDVLIDNIDLDVPHAMFTSSDR